MFKNLPEERLYQLAEAVDRSSYDEGEAIVQQGEEGSMFYLIAGPKRTAQVCPVHMFLLVARGYYSPIYGFKTGTSDENL